jgi:DNA-binding CsgD family transcriptional regulator
VKFEGFRLTPRERDYLAMLADGRSHQWMADELGISKDTVKKACCHVYKKLGARNSAQAVAIGIREGVIV